MQRLTEAGLSLLLLHHPSKKDPRLGHAARGTGALSAYADILLELRLPPGDPATRRRILHGFSRFEETPRRLLLELNPEATDYTVNADTLDDDPFRSALQILLALLHHSPTPLTRQQILTTWPPPAPHPLTLWRWLTRAISLGLIQRTGKGTRTDAFRYGAARAAAHQP